MDVDGEVSGKKRRSRKRPLRVLLGLAIILLLAGGLVFGLRLSGGIEALTDVLRPYLLQMPLVGEPVLEVLESGRRPLSASERRTMELEETEQKLLAWEKELTEERNRLKRERSSVEKLQAALEREREELQVREAEEAEDPGGALSRTVESLEEMSSRKAAGIIARLSRERALKVLNALSQAKMSEVLAKMDPAVAARMVEALSKREASS